MQEVMEDSAVVARGDGWLSAWVGKEYVMMSAETGLCISLSETGGRIWELLEEPKPMGTLCAELAAEYEEESGVVRADVLDFLTHLQAEGAVVIQPA